MTKIIKPMFAPWSKATTSLGSKEVLVTKAWVDAWWIVTYLCWDWNNYDWYNEWQLEQPVSKESIWFSIN